MTPHTRLGRVEDIASTIAFLCSAGGSFINGQTIVVDGGWSSTKYLSEFALTSEWVAAVNVFAVLDQAAARFGDRGAVYLGSSRCHLAANCATARCGWPRRCAAHRRPGARIAIASENRPEIIELMFGVWAAECVVVPINYKLHPREMAQILDDSGAAMVFASPKIAAELAPVTAVPVEVIGSRRLSRAGRLARRGAPATPTRRRWRGCSTPAAPPAGRRARCCRTAT